VLTKRVQTPNEFHVQITHTEPLLHQLHAIVFFHPDNIQDGVSEAGSHEVAEHDRLMQMSE